MNQESTNQVCLSETSEISEISETVSVPFHDRLFCLDLLKAISIISVVFYHAIFVPRSTYTDSLYLLDLIAAPLRFCVPVLFTISFLLFSKGFEKSVEKSDWHILEKRMTRLAIPTLFWFSLTIVLKFVAGGNPLPSLMLAVANGTIFQGAYYLLVLFQMMPLLILFRVWLKSRRAIPFTVVLQGIIFLVVYFMLANASEFDSLLAVLRSVGRPFLLYWIVYAALGVFLWQHWSKLVDRSHQISGSVKLASLGTGVGLVILERSILFSFAQGNIAPFDYNLLTCILMTPIIFLCAVSIRKAQIPQAIGSFIVLVSRYSLGIFCINGIASEVFLSIGSRFANHLSFNLTEILLIQLFGWIVLFFLSLKLSIWLDRLGLGAVVR
jgi:hypothetical protein